LSDEPVITAELEGLLNVEFGPEVYEVERGWVKRFAEAIDDPNPRWQEVAPPTFPCALVPAELLHRMATADCPLKRILNGGNELEYFRPIRIGDTILVTAKLGRLRKMEGKEGTTLFMVMEVTYTDQDGGVVARGRNTYIRY
jgi:hypothetical protein